MAKLAQIEKTSTNKVKMNWPAIRTGADFRIEDICIPYLPAVCADCRSGCGICGDTGMIWLAMSWGIAGRPVKYRADLRIFGCLFPAFRCERVHRPRKAKIPDKAGILKPETGRKLERAKGFEPSTPTLARLCSTPELHPLAPVISVRQAVYGPTLRRLQQGK